MATSGAVLFDFLPVEDMLGVAEAIVRVFHALGDYKHKARNRMKFLMKSLGWEKWHAEFERAYADVKAEGGVPLPANLIAPPAEAAPSWSRPAPPSVDEVKKRVAESFVHGPGIHPDFSPTLAAESSYVALGGDESAAPEAGRATWPPSRACASAI